MIFPKPFLQIGRRRIYFHRTPQEQEEREIARAERRAHRALLKEQKQEIKYFAKAIPIWLAKMGFAYWYKKSERDFIKSRYNPVKFNLALIGDDAYYLRINTKKLPRGVMIKDLRNPDTLDTLTAAADGQVLFEQNETGCWYVIETQYGRGNIPVMVGYAEMLKMMPPDAPPLTFPLGMANNQQPYFGDLDQLINILVGGTKGGGKSNTVNCILCTLLTRNAPHNLRVFLTDLKGGIEFADYGGIPHLGGDVFWTSYEVQEGKKRVTKVKTFPRDYRPKPDEELQPPLGQQIVTEPYPVLPMLAYIEGELERRARLLAGKAKKIGTYNNRFPDKALSYWLLVIDELATLMEDGRYKKEAALRLSEIARKGRAVGIYVILATQTPTSDIIPPQVGNNMDSRLAFRTGSGPASGVLLGSGEYDAEKLPAIPGRFIWKWGGDKIQMQAPFIKDSTVKHTIAQLRAGKYVDARQAELAQKADYLFRFALHTLHGECQSNRLYSMVKDQGFRKSDVLKIMEQYEVRDGQPEIIIDDVIYYLAPAIVPKRIPRWLVPAVDFVSRKHPHPDYNFDLLAFHVPDSEKSEPQVLAETENPETLAGSEDDPGLEELTLQPQGAISLFPNGANGNGAIRNGANGQHAPEPLADEPIEDGDLEWTSQWHYQDEPETQDDPDIPAWLKEETRPKIRLVDDEEEMVVKLPSKPPKKKPPRTKGDFPLAVVLDANGRKKWNTVKERLGTTDDTQALAVILDNIEE